MDSKIDDGGPAYPAPYGTYGMSLREYFAVRAPVDPAAWFQPIFRDRPANAWEGRSLHANTKLTFISHQEARKACGEDFRNANAEAIQEWEQERDKQRLVQWPWAWADAVIKARRPA